MLRASAFAALILGLGFTAASPAPSLFRRNDFDICPQVGNNVAIPDHNTFQFPLQNFKQDMCWPFCIGDQATCAVQAKICFDFVQYTLTFAYPAVTGYTYTEADIWLGFAPPSGGETPQYTTSNGACTISTDQSTVNCIIPYQAIVGGSTNPQWLAGMCPNSDSQGLFLFLKTDATLIGPSGQVSGEGAQSCTDFPTCSLPPVTYWELTYRCSFCQTGESSSSSSSTTSSSTTSSSSTSSSSTPTPTPCELGTAFGYSAANPQSLTLNSQVPLPNTCKRWGWYTTPTKSQLQTGIGGPLYVGAGLNDISKAIQVGTWTAKLNAVGKVDVTYTLSSGFTLAEVHVDLGCTPIPTCSPGQYLYSNTNAALLGSTFTVPSLTYPSCGSGSQVYLIIHAKVDQGTSTSCATPVAT